MSAARTLHLMRHGAPVLAGRMLGITDSLATPEGIAACVARGAPLAFDRIVTSDRQRAQACAAAIGARHGVPVTIDPRWRELDFGAWDGLAPDAIDPMALAAFWQNPDAGPPPGGELWSTLVARVADALGALDGTTLVVAHGGSIRAAIGTLCGFDRRQLWAFDLPCAALLSLRLWPDAAQITGLQA
ncbi:MULTISPECIES: histidine phosphatase family protein [unclassified Sphingomonas]|uniref:histidine phosphatase family protein n=1 Tax=unclassified Sphingomonas TaxID=196159 RepID=UPI0022697EA2|nr:MULTISPECIES: histidine phosphatase family protein [unclassified Sphingomonas]